MRNCHRGVGVLTIPPGLHLEPGGEVYCAHLARGKESYRGSAPIATTVAVVGLGSKIGGKVMSAADIQTRVTDKAKGKTSPVKISNITAPDVTNKSREEIRLANIGNTVTRTVTDTSLRQMTDCPISNNAGSIADSEMRKIAQHSISNRARCDVCRRKLESGEPVFRARVLYRVRPVCRSCASIELTADGQYIRHQCIEYNRSVRCEYCDRPIFGDRWQVPVRHYCSRECQNDAAGERRKQRRALKRKPKPCAMCGQLFKPRRMDSQYCSAACKQVAYRRRSQTTATEVAP